MITTLIDGPVDGAQIEFNQPAYEAIVVPFPINSETRKEDEYSIFVYQNWNDRFSIYMGKSSNIKRIKVRATIPEGEDQPTKEELTESLRKEAEKKVKDRFKDKRSVLIAKRLSNFGNNSCRGNERDVVGVYDYYIYL